MTVQAKAYIGAVIAIALAILGLSASDWPSATQLHAWVPYALLTLTAAAIKVRIPGLSGSMSLSFLFLIAAVTQFPALPTALMATGAAVVQCVWRPEQRLRTVQVAFSAAALTVSIALARFAVGELRQVGELSGAPILLVAAAFVYYASNTLLVSTVVCMTSDRPLSAVWQCCNLGAYPLYICGAILVGIAATDARLAWRGPVLVAPLMVLAVLCQRSVSKTVPVQRGMASAND